MTVTQVAASVWIGNFCYAHVAEVNPCPARAGCALRPKSSDGSLFLSINSRFLLFLAFPAFDGNRLSIGR